MKQTKRQQLAQFLQDNDRAYDIRHLGARFPNFKTIRRVLLEWERNGTISVQGQRDARWYQWRREAA